ncbi:transposase [Lysobacter soli]|uniref:REP-associated tyrosine transposase n=1 Tax=Lysobacter soli TaxID=453783 RepID=UPI00209F7F18|nr:transposase [Lysobacter soli]UTA52740.1 transposase [Lysobacter soli]
MSNYRRASRAGGTYFFTVALLKRRGNDLLVREIDLLRRAVPDVMLRDPFRTHGWVVLPDHLHCVIELPEGDTDFPARWRLIKGAFSKGLPKNEHRSTVRVRRGERDIWQRRYWEHLIRDEADYRAHMDYVHINPLKHGLVQRVADWPYSTFHRLVAAGLYPPDWADGSRAANVPFDD